MKDFLSNVALVGLVYVIIFGAIDFKNIIIAFNEPVDINVDYPDDYNKVKAVKTEINMLVDVFATEETVTKKDGAITDRKYDYYYVMPVYTESDDNPYFVGVKVSSQDKKTYDMVCDATWDYLYGTRDSLETIEFEGGFNKMDEECYERFEDWFEAEEWFEDDKEMEKYVLPLILESVPLEATKKSTFFLAGVLAVCILILILCSRKSKKEQAD